MKRTRLLLIVAGVLVATLPVLLGGRKPEVQRNCAPAHLSIDFWQVRRLVLQATGHEEPTALERFPFATGRIEVLGASRIGGSPVVELLVLLELSGAGDNGVYLASLTGSSKHWQLTDWKHSTNLKRFDHSPSASELAEAVVATGFVLAQVCSKDLGAAARAKSRARGPGCDPTRRQCPDSAEKGHKVFLRNGCPTCHSTDGSRRTGPSLKNLLGRPVTFTDGSRIRRDRAYLRQSVLEPSARIVSDFNPAMPSFRDRLDDRQLAELLYYLESL